MDRNATATPPPEQLQRAPLLRSHPDDDPDDSDANDDRALWCWCCPVYRCLFGGCTGGKNAQPCQTRTLDCIAHVLFWFSGMYQPGGTFSRERWDRMTASIETKPRTDRKLGIISRDMFVPSTKVAGLQIPVRIYEPIVLDGISRQEEHQVMVYYHGGGFCIVSPFQKTMDKLCAKICSKNKLIIVSVGYRLAPENPFPAAVQDCHDVVRWILENPPSSSGLSSLFAPGVKVKEVILAGDSAGGNLACVISSLARDGLDGDLQPCPVPIRISHQVLIYPVLFMNRFIEEDFVDVSAFLPKPVTNWFLVSYLPEGSKSRKGLEELSTKERRLCPFVVGFQGMPPTILISAGLDHLRHENRIAVQQFKMSGVDVVHRHYEHVPHGFVTFHFLKESAQAIDQICSDLNRTIAPPLDTPQSQVGSKGSIEPAKEYVLGKTVEIIGCRGARGIVKEIIPSPAWTSSSAVEENPVGGVVPPTRLIAVIDLIWGKAYCPLTNILVLS